MWYQHIICARIGTEFAGYRIEALIGRGGWSTVYRAESPRLGIRVALKILNADVSEDEGLRERFVRESRLVAGLNHPNVITIFDSGDWQDDLYIAMRYVLGGDLKKRIRDGPLEQRRALAILAQVASGLDAAHAHGLVHRDVKPANVLIDGGSADEAPEIAYVSDFGLIREIHAAGAPTPTGELLGTIDYIAPEQVEGRPVDRRADIYSLGCVAYECLAGRPPFVRENEAAVLWAHLKDAPPRLVDANPALPEGIDEPVARAMAKDPDDRFESCLAFTAALREVIEPEEAEAGTVVLPRARRLRPAGRSRTAAIAAGSLLLGAAAASAAFLLREDDRRVAEGAPPSTQTIVETVVTTAAPAAPSYIPETFRDTCKAVRSPTPDFDGSFVCRSGDRVVRYSHAVSGPAMAAYLRRRLEEVGLPAVGPDELIQQRGSCSDRELPAVEQWIVSGRAGHVAVGSIPINQDDGRVVCYQAGAMPHIEWTTNERGVYAHAYGPAWAPLLRWWRASAGPDS